MEGTGARALRHTNWVAVKEVISSDSIGKTSLFTIYTHDADPKPETLNTLNTHTHHGRSSQFKFLKQQPSKR